MTDAHLGLLAQDDRMVVWWATEVEAISALARRHRDERLDQTALIQSRTLLTELANSWSVVQPSARVRDMAMRLLLMHPLRTADALQLAAAVAWADGELSDHQFICLDERLRFAASREGFIVVPASARGDSSAR